MRVIQMFADAISNLYTHTHTRLLLPPLRARVVVRALSVRVWAIPVEQK